MNRHFKLPRMECALFCQRPPREMGKQMTQCSLPQLSACPHPWCMHQLILPLPQVPGMPAMAHGLWFHQEISDISTL